MISRDQAEVYEILANIAARLLVTVVLLVSYAVVLGFTLYRPNIYLAVLTGTAPFSFALMFRFYFPAKASSPQKRKKP